MPGFDEVVYGIYKQIMLDLGKSSNNYVYQIPDNIHKDVLNAILSKLSDNDYEVIDNDENSIIILHQTDGWGSTNQRQEWESTTRAKEWGAKDRAKGWE